MNVEEKDALFWDLAQPMLLSGLADKGTMMGFPCLRTQGKFFASLEKDAKDLIVKLPAPRVSELIAAGEAQPFAPNGRVFKEWALIDQADEQKWASYLKEAQTFVLNS